MRFWRGLLWGGLLGSAVGLALASNKPQRKPPIVREVQSTAKAMMKKAQVARRSIMDRLD